MRVMKLFVYQFSHVDSSVYVVAHVVELSDVHHVILAVILLGHGCLNPVNHVGAVRRIRLRLRQNQSDDIGFPP